MKRNIILNFLILNCSAMQPWGPAIDRMLMESQQMQNGTELKQLDVTDELQEPAWWKTLLQYCCLPSNISTDFAEKMSERIEARY